MAHLVTFPWIDRDEVEHVYKELFSDNVITQKHAIDRISVWKCRSMNRLPSAVDSTCSFISAQIASTDTEVSSVGRELHLRNLYSMAVIRFVNHITEKGQQGTFARPVHVIASKFGVPEWIVELRHEATHGSLPSLNELKAASCWALTWLRDKFWEPQTTETFGVSSLRSAAVDMLKDSLVTYMQRMFQEISGGEVISCKQLLTDIEHMFEQLGSCACPALTEDGYFILTEEQLECLGYSFGDLRSSGSLLLPPKVLQIWKKIILLLVKTNILADLLLYMATVVTEVSSLRNTLLCSWLYTLVWHNKSKRKKMTKSQPHLFQSSVDIPYKCLLEKCLHLRNKDAESLLNLLVDNASLDMEQKEKLKQFLSVCKTARNNNQEYAVEKVQCINDVMKKEKTSQKSWRKCLEPVDWSKLPIGILPNQILDYASLELGCSREGSSGADRQNLHGKQKKEELEEQSSSDTMETTDSGNISDIGASNYTFDSSVQFQWDNRIKQDIANQMQLF
ncbi:uncharacterized protein LOC123525050 [Mercenaria mercenaria]|uniref:uncharacterized protein LOC123525050 n=1 Tax=Mercenaria mercenaria TaxID=6596 RepID=UPI001E1D47C1|nr:uncharacterized protein LOC123525050 [Mercenaria mercenaria]